VPAYKVDNQENDGHDEQQVNKGACGTKCEPTDTPSDQEYDEKDQKHGSLLFLRLLFKGFFDWNLGMAGRRRIGSSTGSGVTVP
jgi:hypothetical protein